MVFDEAHKATGNYAYCGVMTELRKKEGGMRVLALSASPGNNRQQLQDVVCNLDISRILFRDEMDPEVRKHLHFKHI